MAQASLLIFSCSLTAVALGQTEQADGGAFALPPLTQPTSAVAATTSELPLGRSPVGGNNGLPVITDQMLQPVEAAAHLLTSWQQALRLVRSRSTSLAIARAQIALAQSQARQVRAGSFPTLTANTGVSKLLLPNGIPQVSGGNINDGLDPRWNSGISLNQRVVDFQTWDSTGIAHQATHAATVRSKEVSRAALGVLANAIVGVITTERLTEVSRVSLRSNLSTLDLTRRRARLGAASAVDVLRSEQEVSTNRSDVIGADESLRRAREALGVALGDAQGWGVSRDIDVRQLARDAGTVCSPVADSATRSDVQAAKADVTIAERQVGNSKFAYAPTLDVSSSFNYTSPTGALRPTQWQVRAVVSVPLYDGGRTSAARAGSVANLDIARQQLTLVTRQAKLEVSQAQRGVRVAETNFSISQRAREIAHESARLAQIAFVHGTGTSFDLVESARRRRLAEIDVTLKEFEVVRARITALLAISNCSY